MEQEKENQIIKQNEEGSQSNLTIQLSQKENEEIKVQNEKEEIKDQQIDKQNEQQHQKQKESKSKYSVVYANFYSLYRQTALHFQMSNTNLTIGRSSDNQICLRNKKVSKHHCVIIFQNNSFHIKVNSKNGLYLNSDYLKTGSLVQLNNNDQIHFYFSKNPQKIEEENIGFVFISNQDEAVFIQTLQKKFIENTELDIYQFQKIQQIDENLKDLLTCAICLEFFYNCYTFFPCNHSYCASCCSGHVMKHNKCLECQQPIKKAVKNEFIDNLAEKFCLKFQTEYRSEEDKIIVDRENQFQKNIYYNQNQQIDSDDISAGEQQGGNQFYDTKNESSQSLEIV